MRVNAQTQQLSGDIINGPFAGRSLDQLSLTQLQMLLEYCQQSDSASAKLLVNYLNQRFGNQWQQQQNRQSSNMTKEEAYDLLGLTPDTNREAIIQAHRKLMQKVHPDRGGNDYLAAKINQAKDLLFAIHSQ
jgi:flagellar basal body P-ring protein FlgI